MLHILVYNSLRFANNTFQVAYVTIKVILVFQHEAHQFQVFVLFPGIFGRVNFSFFFIAEYEHSFAFPPLK